MDQATFLRKLTGKQRMEQAFMLSDLMRELALKNIRKGKKMSKQEALRELQKRLYSNECNT